MTDPPVKQACPSEAVGVIDGILSAASFRSPPKVGLHLLKLCGSSTAGAEEITNVIETDPALAARLIRLANTVHYGGGIPATSVQAATVRLGTDKIKSVALAFEVAGITDGLAGDRFDFESYWQGCLTRGCMARAVALDRHRGIAGEAFLVGLLQDLGVPLLADHAPEAHGNLARQSAGCHLRLAVLESQSFGFNHIHLVARLFQHWRMPALLTDAISRHHTRPPMHSAADPALRLWQIAYFVGALPIGDKRDPTFYDASLSDMLHTTFGIAGPAEGELFRRAEQEFRDVRDMFRPYVGRDVSAAALMAQAAALLDAQESLAASADTPRTDPRCGRGVDCNERVLQPRETPPASVAEALDIP